MKGDVVIHKDQDLPLGMMKPGVPRDCKAKALFANHLKRPTEVFSTGLNLIARPIVRGVIHHEHIPRNLGHCQA